VKVGERFGVQYRLSTSVTGISLSPDNKTAKGVTLDDGTQLEADVVVINADLVYAYNNLLPKSSQAKSLSKRAASCSSISFYWSLSRQIPELKAHNIFLAEHYKESFDQIFKEQSIPAQPSFYVNVPSRVDPSASPEGTDSIVVLVPVGHLLESGGDGVGLSDQSSAQDWDRMVRQARDTVFETIRARTGADLQRFVTNEIINTPGSWKETFNLDKGAILGLSHSFFNVLCFRPKTKHPKINELYFVGASTHPGTGVPIVLAGSKITAGEVLDRFGMTKPWADAPLVVKSNGKGIDEVKVGTVWIWLQWAFALFFVFLGIIFGSGKDIKFTGDW
jgi:phytoene desaturase (3,4-didehydrolycopene-forming)